MAGVAPGAERDPRPSRSCFIFDSRYHLYYLHGMTVHSHADVRFAPARPCHCYAHASRRLTLWFLFTICARTAWRL
jgi:hypothetical protein